MFQEQNGGSESREKRMRGEVREVTVRVERLVGRLGGSGGYLSSST